MDLPPTIGRDQILLTKICYQPKVVSKIRFPSSSDTGEFLKLGSQALLGSIPGPWKPNFRNSPVSQGFGNLILETHMCRRRLAT